MMRGGQRLEFPATRFSSWFQSQFWMQNSAASSLLTVENYTLTYRACPASILRYPRSLPGYNVHCLLIYMRLRASNHRVPYLQSPGQTRPMDQRKIYNGKDGGNLLPLARARKTLPREFQAAGVFQHVDGRILYLGRQDHYLLVGARLGKSSATLRGCS